MNIGRYPTSSLSEGKHIPNEWTELLIKTLNDTYEAKAASDECFFDVYGKTFEEEFILIISYIHKTDYSKSPITLFISHDNLDTSKKFKEAIDSAIDLTGLIFDDIFSNEDWNEYVLNWTQNDFEKNQFFYKITRENISLTIQAEELLKQ
ncbi:MAG: hypothetical protein N4A33_02425 [Bacteriovoracaceae bacterium]|jgi:hypothetical protein|nr:hypothetical protein [Bacteriovoracaceae bacterium]